MVQIGLVGIGAGAAAALLFASVASGSLISVALFYVAPLPILIAAMGWSYWAGLLAATSSATILGVIFGLKFFFAFALSVAAPAWWLGYLAMLARPGAAPGVVEWYPAGQLVLWTAVLGALAVVALIPYFGFDDDSFNAGLRAAFERMLRLRADIPADQPIALPGFSDPKRLIDFLVAVIPPAAAALGTITHMLNLWLAGRILKISGRLQRPWPDLSAMHFPPIAAGLAALAIAGSFASGLTGLTAGIFASALLIAYGALGLAVLHAITLGARNRGIVLGSVYLVLIFLGWPILAICMLGLADSAIDLRARVAARRHPPTIPRP